MISLALVAGLVVVAAAAAAVVLVDGRAVAGALFVALAVSPFATDPLPGALEIAARLVAAMLAAYVLWIVMKGGAVKSAGTAIGIVAELGVAAGAYALGWWLEPIHPLQGPIAEQATGFALVALAVLPLAGANVLRAGIGIVLIILGAGLVMQAWLGPAPALVQLALTVLLLAVPAGLSLVVDADDQVAKLVPAVERTLSEPAAEEPIQSRRPELELEEPEPVDQSEATAPGEPVEAVRAAEPGPAQTRASEPGSAARPRRPGGRRAGAAEKPVVGPRPSIRFLGGSSSVRRVADAPPQGDTPAPEVEPGESEAGQSPELGPRTDGARVRDVRDPRNPRYKRPLR